MANTVPDQTALPASPQAGVARKLDKVPFIEMFNGRLQETPNDPDVLCEVATISLGAGRAQEGLRWLQNALQVAPNHLKTHQTLAAYYQAMDNPVLAARHRAIARKLKGQERTKP